MFKGRYFDLVKEGRGSDLERKFRPTFDRYWDSREDLAQWKQLAFFRNLLQFGPNFAPAVVLSARLGGFDSDAVGALLTAIVAPLLSLGSVWWNQRSWATLRAADDYVRTREPYLEKVITLYEEEPNPPGDVVRQLVRELDALNKASVVPRREMRKFAGTETA